MAFMQPSFKMRWYRGSHQEMQAPVIVVKGNLPTIMFPYGCPTADVKSQEGKKQEDH